GLTAVDALYYVTATITTTGYGDITPREDSLKLYAIALMLFGSVLFAALYSVITDMLIRTRFEQLIGRDKVPDGNHIVVAGLGNLGYRVVEELRRDGTEVIAIERSSDAEFVAALHAFELGGTCLIVLLRRAVDASLEGLRPSDVRSKIGMSILLRRNGPGLPFKVLCDDEPFRAEEDLIAMVSHPLAH